MSRIISYRGLLAHEEQRTINLHTKDGKTGYKIVKFELMSKNSNSNIESLTSIYTVKQATVGGNVDFDDVTLLAAGMRWQSTSQASVHESTIIFDSSIFNQDIFISTYDGTYNAPMNFYLELEQVDLTEDQALVAIVKNLRNEQ